MDNLVWSDAGFAGTATLWAGQVNTSRKFRAYDKETDEPVTWDDPPVMEIPTSTDPLMVPATVNPSTGKAQFEFSAEQSDAALAAGSMWWVEAGVRIGTIRVIGQ